MLINLVLAFILISIIYKAIAILVSKKLRRTLTALGDIPLLGIPRKDGLKIRGTAVICGGSIAGLLSARICSDHFEQVIIVEPEEWVTTAEGLDNGHRTQRSPLDSHKRARVPQYASFHGFQPFLTMAHRKLFPNYDLEVAKTGGRMVHADANLHYSGVRIKAPWHQYRDRTDFPTFANLRRAGYETTLRRLVITKCPNVKYVTGAVTALVKSESSSETIGSVRVRSHDGEENSVLATLVVDCTGPALGGFRWLQDFSSSSVMATESKMSSLTLAALKTTYDPKMSYSTCEFDVPSRLISPLKDLGFPDDYKEAGIIYINFPNSKLDRRTLVIGWREHNFLQFVCGGWDIRDRMTSIQDIKHFLSQMVLAHPLPDWISRTLDLFEEEQAPLTYVHSRCPASVYIQYNLAKQLPSNFIAIGDSVMQLNPVRGNGCTKACIEAVSLNKLLAQCTPMSISGIHGTDHLPKDFSRNYFAIQARRTGPLWNAFKYDDYSWDTTTPTKGEDRQTSGSWIRAYGTAFTPLMLRDKDVSAVWWHSIFCLTPSTDLLSPTIMLKIAWMRMRNYVGF